ncbi:hypothetical protein [Microcoleus sp. FACHB-68]|uniref:hypothetical protein n=1 Tax=Microcoleus sp. FACHB-68 TaxID=2692826 RepID=UPI00168624BA|nr:hypothetical protein [Microcoleus sp. FACHB-68]MBD1937903.1 hypothetical protein [Microcoleus sp. FACHB-68]
MNRKHLLYVLSATMTLQFFVSACGNSVGENSKSNQPNGSQNAEKQVASTAVINTNQKSEGENSKNGVVTDIPVDKAKAEKFTDTAKFLAGIKVDAGSPLASVQQSKAWNDHAYYFDSAWQRLDAQQLSKIRKWSSNELTSLNQSSEPIFYPFSGPDFLYAYSFFPKGSDYVLAGLEPVGDIPEIEKIPPEQMDRKLQEITTSLNAILQLSFFRTNDMKVDLAEKGVLPVLFVFLARTNNKILDVQHITLQKDAKIQAFENAQKAREDKNLIPGIKISFLPQGESKPRTLYYFSIDLSNAALQKTPEFNTFVKQFPEPITYLKAASYLMHREDFSNIRDLILSESSNLLQDDSGMPVKYVDSSQWNLKFYGNYTQPIDLFSTRYQGDLRDIYKSDSSIKPLDFGIGYKYQVNESNLMLATSKKEQPAPKP